MPNVMLSLQVLICNCLAVRGTRAGNTSAWATVLSVFLTIQGKAMAKPFQQVSGKIALKLYNSYNHCPRTRPAHVGKSWLQAPLQVLQNSRCLYYELISAFASNSHATPKLLPSPPSNCKDLILVVFSNLGAYYNVSCAEVVRNP